MCGIVGFIGFEDKLLLEEMKKSINHRGPDAHGSFIDKDVCLGHLRLSIIDLSDVANQPMCNENENIWIIFNGEIYNFQEIRVELEACGHKFKSNSDTEVIIHAYEEYGFDCLHKFRGMFAFAIWDSNKKLLFLARDRVGIKPLYYTTHDKKFIFASEIKALLQADFIKREVDINTFYCYLSFINSPLPKTLFKDIYKLEPGHYLIIKNGEIQKKKYWDILQNTIDYSITESRAISEIGEILKDSIRSHMVADVPQGVFLSGGLDSSTVVALMAEMQENAINTFSIATGDDEKYNELNYARIIADKFNTNHHEIYLSEDNIIKFLPQLVHQSDEPIADPANTPVYYLAKEARQNNIKVLHVGEGGDELFCGYPVYKYETAIQSKLRYIRKAPDFMRSMLNTSINAFYYLPTNISNLKISTLKELIQEKNNLIFPSRNVIGFSENEKKQIVSFTPKKSTYELLKNWSREVEIRNNHSKFEDAFLQKTRTIEFKNRLPELLLMRVDKFTMAASTEARVPLLDHILVEYAMQIPAYTLHMKNGDYKYLLKQVMKEKLPKEIISRRKAGFGAPMSKHMQGEIKQLALQEFERQEIRQFINEKRAKTIVEKHMKRGYGDTPLKTWILLNFALWYRYWILGEKIKI